MQVEYTTRGVISATAQCIWCGRIFPSYPSQAARRRYCSHQCKSLARAESAKGGTVERSCAYCGASFVIHPSDAARRVYCSLACKHLGRRQQTIARFWANVDQSSECWEWKAARDPYGYGAARYEAKKIHSHRLAYILTYGPIPKGMQICHRCDNPPCCRPDHLFLGTAADNAADREQKGRGRHGRKRLNQNAPP